MGVLKHRIPFGDFKKGIQKISMSNLTSSQIPVPADEQKFEQANVHLWREILRDPAVEPNGRRGTRQNGVDVSGCRNHDPEHIVGIQCKLKGLGKQLDEAEVRAEVEKAKTFKPPLREYFIVTTAPNDPGMQELARTISIELKKDRFPFRVHIWGWGVMQDRIHEYEPARKAFDPEYSPYTGQIYERVDDVITLTERAERNQTASFERIEQKLTELGQSGIGSPSDATIRNDLEAELDAEIDDLRQLVADGKAKTASAGLEKLKARVFDNVSGRLKFRITANIAGCHLSLGEQEVASGLYSEAYEYAPKEPAAAAHAVLGFLLRNEHVEAIRFGRAKLKDDPSNEWLAGYLIQAMCKDETIKDPFLEIPDDIVDSFPVKIAVLDFTRRRGSFDEWQTLAEELYAEKPDDDHVIQFYAEAEMQSVLDSEHYKQTAQLNAADHERLQRACELMRGLWDKVCGSEVQPNHECIAICCNLVFGYAEANEVAEAISIANQGLKYAPDDQGLLLRCGVLAVEYGESDLAERVLQKLSIEPEATILNLRYYAQTGQWSKVARTDDEKLLRLPEEERELFVVAKKLAVIKEGPASLVEDKLRELMADHLDSVRGQIIIAYDAKELFLNELADEAFANARGALADDQHYAGRFMVAIYAGRYDQNSDVIDILQGRLSTEVDSGELRQLASAYAHQMPIRNAGIAFFKALPEALAKDPYFLRMSGTLHYNRGALAQAETAFSGAYIINPDLTCLMALVQTHHRRSQPEKITSLINDTEVLTLKGVPYQKMGLSQLLAREGRKDEALELAYKTLRAAPNDADVNKLYFGLLIDTPNAPVIPAAVEVGSDIWVHIENTEGGDFSFIIEEGESKPAENILTPDDHMARLSMGLKVGETFSVDAKFGDSVEWTIKELKHKTLHALHDMMRNFETRFPDADGFYSIRIKGNDIEPMLAAVRKQSEAAEFHVELYAKHKIPLAMAAGRRHGGTIAFAQHVRRTGGEIVSCLGGEDERLHSYQLLEAAWRHKDTSAVLDTYTAWIVASCDAFDVLKAIFGHLYIPQSVLDELHQMVDDLVIHGGEQMSMSFENGEYIRRNESPEEVVAQKEMIKSYLAKIQEHCEALPISAPDEQTEIVQLLVDTFEANSMDSAFIAADGNILLSEDMYYRQIAKNELGVDGCWLQSVFYFAREMSTLESDRYSELIVQLAAMKHSYLSIDAATLKEIFDQDAVDDMRRFEAVANCIGGKNANFQSHIAVVSGFLHEVWKDAGIEDLKKWKATNLLVTALIRNLQQNWNYALAALHMVASNPLKDYLRSWVKGRFLSLPDYYGAINAWHVKMRKK